MGRLLCEAILDMYDPGRVRLEAALAELELGLCPNLCVCRSCMHACVCVASNESVQLCTYERAFLNSASGDETHQCSRGHFVHKPRTSGRARQGGWRR